LIERITTILGITDGKTNEKLTPVGKPLSNKDLQGVPRKYDWEFCGAIGMLTYLTGSARLDFAMATHQCTRFSISPMRLHKLVVMRIRQYLLSTQERGIIYSPDSSRVLKSLLMLTLLVDGTQKMLKMLIMFTLAQDM